MTEILTTAITGLVAIIVCVLNNRATIKASETKQKANLDAVEKKSKEETTALKVGVQALLRAQMIHDYNKWSDEGFAPIYARENFENCWKVYETLGENGVMNDIHEKFKKLPTRKPVSRNNSTQVRTNITPVFVEKE